MILCLYLSYLTHFSGKGRNPYNILFALLELSKTPQFCSEIIWPLSKEIAPDSLPLLWKTNIFGQPIWTKKLQFKTKKDSLLFFTLINFSIINATFFSKGLIIEYTWLFHRFFMRNRNMLKNEFPLQWSESNLTFTSNEQIFFRIIFGPWLRKGLHQIWD